MPASAPALALPPAPVESSRLEMIRSLPPEERERARRLTNQELAEHVRGLHGEEAVEDSAPVADSAPSAVEAAGREQPASDIIAGQAREVLNGQGQDASQARTGTESGLERGDGGTGASDAAGHSGF